MVFSSVIVGVDVDVVAEEITTFSWIPVACVPQLSSMSTLDFEITAVFLLHSKSSLSFLLHSTSTDGWAAPSQEEAARAAARLA